MLHQATSSMSRSTLHTPRYHHLCSRIPSHMLIRGTIQVYMPITYALNMYGLSFATLSALLVWVILEKRHVMADAARRVPHLVIESLPGRSREYSEDERGDPDVPLWWYLIGCILALFMAIFAVEWWDVELRWYGVLLACLVTLVFYPPVCLEIFRAIATFLTDLS